MSADKKASVMTVFNITLPDYDHELPHDIEYHEGTLQITPQFNHQDEEFRYVLGHAFKRLAKYPPVLQTQRERQQAAEHLLKQLLDLRSPNIEEFHRSNPPPTTSPWPVVAA